jgi:ribosomal protein S18 acetylase RimI-like enzyme
MKIIVRPWQKGDLESIRIITWRSWISTYSSFIPESDLKSYFDIYYTEVSFLSIFNDPLMQGFIAEVNGHPAGYIRLFFDEDENRLYVPSLYLLPDFQGQDIGGRLLEAAEGYAVEKNLDELWLGVMVKNRQALGFYRKVGFQFVREEPFTMGKTTVHHLIGYKKIRRNPLLNQKTYATFNEEESLNLSTLVEVHPEPKVERVKRLPRLCLELLSEQKMTWLDLREAYESLKEVKERDVHCRGFSVRLQYNPIRIKSSLAGVAEKIPTERQCFLCLDHLPAGQRGILYRSEYLILCNPMPVFSSHLTVSHLDHRPQAVTEHIDTLLQLVADFGSGWTVLYNGPKCGASAPDHLHFQVAPSGEMAIEEEILEEKRLTLMTQVGGVSLYRGKNLGREVILLEGKDPMAVEDVFKDLLDALKKVLFTDEEPMMNIAVFKKERRREERKWCLVVFPRKKHRPDVFSREGEARIVVSPGVIDMGGLLITPVEKDFEQLDAAAVEGIFGEVSLESKTVEKAIIGME